MGSGGGVRPGGWTPVRPPLQTPVQAPAGPPVQPPMAPATGPVLIPILGRPFPYGSPDPTSPDYDFTHPEATFPSPMQWESLCEQHCKQKNSDEEETWGEVCCVCQHKLTDLYVEIDTVCNLHRTVRQRECCDFICNPDSQDLIAIYEGSCIGAYPN